MNEQRIEKDGITYAIVFAANTNVTDGMRFITSNEDPLQVGVFERDAGYAVMPHMHNKRDIHLDCPGECIFFQSGKASVEIFDNDWNVIKTVIVNGGDCLVIMKGGHALTMLEPTRMLEVKQGPYLGREKDKTFQNPQ